MKNIKEAADRAIELYQQGENFKYAIRLACQEFYGKYWGQYYKDVLGEVGRRNKKTPTQNKKKLPEVRTQGVQLPLF